MSTNQVVFGDKELKLDQYLQAGFFRNDKDLCKLYLREPLEWLSHDYYKYVSLLSDGEIVSLASAINDNK